MSTDNLDLSGFSFEHFNADTQSELLLAKRSVSFAQYLPRQSVYGESSAYMMGLDPVEAGLDKILTEADLEGAIKRAHETKSFPMYWDQRTWGKDKFKYYQNGIGYCWTFGGTAGLMTLAPLLRRTEIKLAPVSMGFCVNWANRGWHLDGWANAAKTRGVAVAPDGNVNSLNRDARFWEKYEATRVFGRLRTAWDTNNGASIKTMALQCASILCYGRPLYIAYDWWSHALCAMGLLWTPGTFMNLTWVIRNSHGEDHLITLEGQRGVPSEAIGLIDLEPIPEGVNLDQLLHSIEIDAGVALAV